MNLWLVSCCDKMSDIILWGVCQGFIKVFESMAGVRSSYYTLAMHNNRKTCDKHVDCCDSDMTPDKYKYMSCCLFDFLFAANVEPQRVNWLCRRWKKMNHYFHSSKPTLRLRNWQWTNLLALYFVDYLNRKHFFPFLFFQQSGILLSTLTCMRLKLLVTNLSH